MPEPESSDEEAIVAVCFLTHDELRNLGSNLKCVYPVPVDDEFDDLLEAIARASRGSRLQ